ncbi:hypothetical protein BGU41_00470 [Clostridioides difficile]|nr:hypothetical protein BGU41_00470 [Clostridioides difficile]
MWCEVYWLCVYDQCPYIPQILRKLPGTYILNTDEGKPLGIYDQEMAAPEIQECDLWQGNICGVRCMSL